jgi:hypothetical protein
MKTRFVKDAADVNGALVDLFWVARKREEQNQNSEAEISALWYVKAMVTSILEELPKAKRKLVVAQIMDRAQFIAEYHGLPD